MSKEGLLPKELATHTSRAIAKTIIYIILFVIVSAIIKYMVEQLLPSFGVNIVDYQVYIQILLSIVFGYFIVSSFAEVFYWATRAKYGHPTAVAIRNTIKIVGIGALIAAIAGGIAGGTAGVALGGFIGIVIGFASQQILGQAVAGLFLLIIRPFKIGDSVVIAGEDGVIEDVTTLFTIVRKADGTRAFVPNSMVIGSKIYLKPKSTT